MTWQTPTPAPPSRRRGRREEFADLLVSATIVMALLVLAATAMDLVSDCATKAPDLGQPPISDSGEAPVPRGDGGQ